MKNKNSDNLISGELLATVSETLACEKRSREGNALRECSLNLATFADQANDQSRQDLFRGADMLSRLLEVASSFDTNNSNALELPNELVEFVASSTSVLQTAIGDSETNLADEIDDFVQLAESEWQDYLNLLDGSESSDPWELTSPGGSSPDATAADEPLEDKTPEPGNGQIELMLSALANKPTEDSAKQELATQKPTTRSEKANSKNAKPNKKADPKQSFDDRIAKQALRDDRELLEAYLDDTIRCLGDMEKAALAMDSLTEKENGTEFVQAFCRELHTLKGASASVGMSGLASYLHDLETSLEGVFNDEACNADAEPLFAAIDRVRAELDSLQPQSQPSPEPTTKPESNPKSLTQTHAKPRLENTSSSKPASSTSSRSPVSGFGSGDDSSIRIRATKLDRLMDMLAELVVLRNRRDSNDTEYDAFNEELRRCASRLNFAEEQTALDHELGFATSTSSARNNSSTVTEVAKDIEAVSRGLRELQKPVGDDNMAISRFIRDFRQELMQLRRVPVSGLFSRLQRAARDAAKSENKQVQVVLVGEQAGLEQEIQERLYDSLLHVVRNSVSHGVESKENRIKAGKPAVGVVTLEAYSSAQLLVIEVRDDGNGINFDAIRVRGIEKGLINPNQRPTNEQLANLIFHPGFSTREQASEVSGRGVGMDIVAKTIEKLRGKIEVDSVTGQGTTIRLLIPLRTGIEHVMVFRSEGQLFALPMQSVTAAKSSNANIENVARLSFSSALSVNNRSAGSGDVLILNQVKSRSDRSGDKSSRAKLALAVDELIGPEEVVVRGLPNFLKNHPLFCGITLSGSGEKVLLLESEKIVEFCEEQTPGEDGTAYSATEDSQTAKRALVVDDSLTARKVLTKLLHEQGFSTAEAGDGIEAIERLHLEKFDIVFTDLDMPRLGGLELLSDIQTGQYCDSPVVVVSSRVDETFRTRAMDFGANDYIAKPVSKNSITELLDQLQRTATNCNLKPRLQGMKHHG